MKRKALSMKKSKKLFTAGALNTKAINVAPIPQRAGLRL
nr:MAG: hypothetical protein [Microvirus sp.]